MVNFFYTNNDISQQQQQQISSQQQIFNQQQSQSNKQQETHQPQIQPSPVQSDFQQQQQQQGGSGSLYQSISMYSIQGNDNLLTTGRVTFVAQSLGGNYFTATDVRTVSPLRNQAGFLTSSSRLEAFFIPISNTRVHGERTRYTYFYAQGNQASLQNRDLLQDSPSALPFVNNVQPSPVMNANINQQDNQLVRASFSVSSYSRGRVRGAVTFFIPIGFGNGQNTFSMRDLETEQPAEIPPANMVPIQMTKTELFQTVFNGAFITGTRTKISVTFAPGVANAIVQHTASIGEFSVRVNTQINGQAQTNIVAATILTNQMFNGISIPDNTILNVFDNVQELMPSKDFPSGMRNMPMITTSSIELFNTMINGKMVQGRRTRYSQVPANSGNVANTLVNRVFPINNNLQSGHVTISPYSNVDMVMGWTTIGQMTLFSANDNNANFIDIATVQADRRMDVGQMVQQSQMEIFPTLINGVTVTGTRTRFINTFTVTPDARSDFFQILRGLPCPCENGNGGQMVHKRSVQMEKNNSESAPVLGAVGSGSGGFNRRRVLPTLHDGRGDGIDLSASYHRNNSEQNKRYS